MIRYKYIAVEGNIGVGKTSLAKAIAKKLSSDLILEEFKKNHFLPLFYKNQKKYSLPLEITFLIDRYQQLNVYPMRDENYMVSDYLFAKSNIFSKNNLSNEDYRVFFKMFKTLDRSVIQPDIIIFLENTLENLKKNILKRGRIFEGAISLEYLENIRNSYEHFLGTSKKYRIIKINVEGLDFVKNKSDFRIIYDLLKKEYPCGTTLIIRE